MVCLPGMRREKFFDLKWQLAIEKATATLWLVLLTVAEPLLCGRTGGISIRSKLINAHSEHVKQVIRSEGVLPLTRFYCSRSLLALSNGDDDLG